MKIQTEAANVWLRAHVNMRAGLLREKPAWLDIVAKYPPNHSFIKKAHLPNKGDPRKLALTGYQSDDLSKTRLSKSERKSKNRLVHRVPKLVFMEDSLRKVFYKQHPWELARPKNLVENSGEDNKKCNWKHMLQLHKQLDGESVVQRTLWLFREANMPLFEAYDKARFEFYKLRMSEEMESHVAREESSMYGAVFGHTVVDTNLKEEQKYIDIWTEVGQEKTKIMHANKNRSSAPAGSVIEEGSLAISLFEEVLLSEPNAPEDPEEE
ncbi:37S ribosomal protein S25, mitochondrial [Candida viswanathii]|uniref:37S ribosomal protein S25, mitochondrial n=1 Tax=Candida viswanathii TaxID=5486 RepID=A0A367Y3Y0_9ASCO|nr:37S ribosomal protein S25, mitochondrial [Candida viswanathii]